MCWCVLWRILWPPFSVEFSTEGPSRVYNFWVRYTKRKFKEQIPQPPAKMSSKIACQCRELKMKDGGKEVKQRSKGMSSTSSPLSWMISLV